MKILRPLLTLAALAATASLALAAPEVTPVIPTNPTGSVAVLLGVDSIRKELKLTSLQRAILSDIRDEYREESRAVVARTKSDLESKKQAQAQLDKLTASSERRALRVLNDDQRARLTQLQYQIRGGYELLSPALQQKLGLTEPQKAKIAKIWVRGEKYTSKVNAKFEKGEISFQKRLIDLRENRLDRSDDFLAVLTPKQYSVFLHLMGEQFPAAEEQS